MHEGKPVLNIQIGGNGASTARLYIFVECAWFLQSLFQQNKTNVSFREIARLIARYSLANSSTKGYFGDFMNPVSPTTAIFFY